MASHYLLKLTGLSTPWYQISSPSEHIIFEQGPSLDTLAKTYASRLREADELPSLHRIKPRWLHGVQLNADEITQFYRTFLAKR